MKYMKIVLTGSIGNIGKPLTGMLVQQGHDVTVITTKAERQKEIESLGAKAATGTMEDPGFLTQTFSGADIVYLMETLEAVGGFFNKELDYLAAVSTIVEHYREAVLQSGVKKIIHLSSIGAHMETGNGILRFHYNAEKILNTLPADVSIKFMRPVGFYYNLLSFIPVIKSQGAIISNRGGNVKEPWVSPVDIAAVIAEEMNKPFEGRIVRYIASDELSPDEVAGILGEAIGIPGLRWKEIPGGQLLQGMLAAGMNEAAAHGLLEMQAAQGSGILYEDYFRNRPQLGPTKLTEYAKHFAKVYHQ